MNDITTRLIVAYILDRMGFKKLSSHAKKDDTNIDVYINYIKYRDKKNLELNQFIKNYL